MDNDLERFLRTLPLSPTEQEIEKLSEICDRWGYHAALWAFYRQRDLSSLQSVGHFCLDPGVPKSFINACMASPRNFSIGHINGLWRTLAPEYKAAFVDCE